MIITVKREYFTEHATVGRLLIGDKFNCWTLEDCYRDGPKIPRRTAIPIGNYEVVVTFSRRFNRALPLLLNVPNFEGVRIHPGNTDEDTEGCILVGMQYELKPVARLLSSRIAFSSLFLDIDRATKTEKVTIVVENTPIIPALPKEETRNA